MKRDVSVITMLSSLLYSCAIEVPTARPQTADTKCVLPSEVRAEHSWKDEDIVSICGYFVYDFEDINLYDSKKDALDDKRQACLPIAVGDEVPRSQLRSGLVKMTGDIKRPFCPQDSICLASCSQEIGLIARIITGIGN